MDTNIAHNNGAQIFKSTFIMLSVPVTLLFFGSNYLG
jgi:hypothetical protein